jgi:hypothetical protein
MPTLRAGAYLEKAIRAGLLALLAMMIPAAAPVFPREPGEAVPWVAFPSQKAVKEPRWGPFLTDLETHLPAQYGKQYQSPDLIIHAHETSHGIHAHLRTQYALKHQRVNCFYVGQHRAAVLAEPKLKLSQIAALVPEPLRLGRFKLYLVGQQKDWENEPLYLFDEWVAYVNGAQAGIEMAQKGLYAADKNDAVFALLELNVYAIYTVLATERHDRTYNRTPLTEFLAWNLKRSMALYHAGSRLGLFNWDGHQHFRRLQTGGEAAELRRFLRRLYGERWCREVMGFASAD